MKRLHLACLALAACAWVSSAHAHLGSFAPADGYNLNIFTGTANWSDVTYFDAGAYGANAGGGSGPNNIVPDSGNWTLLSPVGGFFPSAAARNAAVGTAPPYPNFVPPGTVPAYMVGNHFPGRFGDGSNLAFRNDTPLGTGAAKYEYSLDQYDVGANPATITSGNLITQFYFCPNPPDAPNPGGLPADKFTLSFRDSTGNIGVEWGYARDNEVTWRTIASGAWNYTGIYADATNWDGLRVDVNLTNDTFQMDYYDVGTNTWSTLAPAGTALGLPMQDLTVLRWQLEDGVFSGTGGKNYFDDFGFRHVVPEPATWMGATLAAGFAVCVLRGRRRAG